MIHKCPPSFTGLLAPWMGHPGHEGFIKKAGYISTGNVVSNAQHSSYIRPRQETECNGFTFPVGRLQQADLDVMFGKRPELRVAEQYIRRDPYFETNRAIAYDIRHYNGDTRVTHGVIITDDNYRLIRRFDREDLGIGRAGKSVGVIDFCLQFLCFPEAVAA